MSYTKKVPEGYEKCDWTEATHITTEDQCVNELLPWPNSHNFSTIQSWVQEGAMLLKKAPVEECVSQLIAQIVLRDSNIPYTTIYNLVYSLIDQVKKEIKEENNKLKKALDQAIEVGQIQWSNDPNVGSRVYAGYSGPRCYSDTHCPELIQFFIEGKK